MSLRTILWNIICHGLRYIGEREVRSSSREFKTIYKEMRVMESALFEEGEVLIQSRVRKVLELIGVRNLYPMDIIKHHILPQFTTGTWKVNTHTYCQFHLCLNVGLDIEYC